MDKKRNYNTDLLRILATFFVVMLHVLGQGGVLNAVTPNTVQYWIAWALEVLAYCAVDCFALVTGYVMAQRKVKLHNAISTWAQILFYSLVLGIIPVCMFQKLRTVKNILFLFFPITTDLWWYASAYFGLLLFIPVLNAAVAHIEKRTYQLGLILVCIGTGVLDCLIPAEPYGLQYGYSTIWLMIVYMFGAYFKLYGIPKCCTAGKSILGYFAMAALTLGFKFAAEAAGWEAYSDAFISYTSATILCSALFLFFFCQNIRIGKIGQAVVRFFTPATLGVYLIHVHPFIFKMILKDAFAVFTQMQLSTMLLCVMTVAVLIFVLSSLLDLFRHWLFRVLGIYGLCQWLEGKILSALYSTAKDNDPMEVAK